MTFIVSLFSGFTLSFLGCLAPGVINLNMATTTLRNGLQKALWFALGASVVQCVQLLIAVEFARFFARSPYIQEGARWAAVIVFMALAIYYLNKKRKTPKQLANEGPSRFPPFIKGLIIGCLNFFAIPYWIFSTGFLSAYDLFPKETFVLFLFVCGVALGTFTLLYLYARFSEYIKDHIDDIIHKTNRTVGWLFVILTVVQLGFLMVAYL